MGIVRLAVASISASYALIFLFGGPLLEGGKQLVAKSNYFALACVSYTILTLGLVNT